ncbi:SLOG family protein [Spirillospora sp. NBC_01491]|uniref:SLOG family protein n=1 Tax=Spirillospora sp. NBC_01491 TaxID=2976007 RepID=UPI002E367C63|nr:SLOG family protein [Spirillospora sp. NBC_01491]
MRILVTGSRDWDDAGKVGTELYRAIDCSPGLAPVTVVHGACPTGADRIASEFCESEAAHLEQRGVSLVEERHPASWHHHGNRAGLKRNREMVDAGADVCLAFIAPCSKPNCAGRDTHGSHGASHAADLARRAGIPVRQFTPRDNAGGDAA